jgi:hypothetical protein
MKKKILPLSGNSCGFYAKKFYTSNLYPCLVSECVLNVCFFYPSLIFESMAADYPRQRFALKLSTLVFKRYARDYVYI